MSIFIAVYVSYYKLDLNNFIVIEFHRPPILM